MFYLDIWLFTNSHLCQFIEIVHKIINWYMKNYKVENKNVGLKVGWGEAQTYHCPPIKNVGAHAPLALAPPPPSPASYASAYDTLLVSLKIS